MLLFWFVAISGSYATTVSDSLQLVMDGTSPTCAGYNNGSVSAVGIGGWGPYDFTWSTGYESHGYVSILMGVGAGTYSVTIVDMDGAIRHDDYTLVDLPALEGSIEFVETGTDSSLIAHPLGGTPPYTYEWNTGATTQSIENVHPGDYFVTITDANGCSTVLTYHISNPDMGPLVLEMSGTDPDCHDDESGSVTATGSGGWGPYDFTWSTGDTGHGYSSTLNGLGAGTYSVTIVDMDGAIRHDSYTLHNPPALEGEIVYDDNTNSLTANGVGGTPPYTYLWNTGATTQTITDLHPGTYTVTITDANGCTVVLQYTIPGSAELTINFEAQEPACHGYTNGEVTATVSGGEAPYTFVWNTGYSNQGNSSTVYGGAGEYTVTVTDINGEEDVASYILGQPSLLSVDIDMNVSGTDTFLVANPTGGTSPFTYLWSTNETSQSILVESPNDYYVTVTDANGCDAVEMYHYNGDQGPIYLSLENLENPTCHGYTNGSLTVMAHGGTSPYDFSWNTGQHDTGDISRLYSLSAGIYIVTVVDVDGIQRIESFTINDPPEVIASITLDGNVLTGHGTGGTPPYTYEWSNGDTTQNIINPAEGDYYLTVTDANGCTDVAFYHVDTSVVELEVVMSGENPGCAGDSTGSVTATPATGTPPYSFTWSTGYVSTGTTSTLSDVGAGTYSVTVVDADGQEGYGIYTLNSPTSLETTIVQTGDTCSPALTANTTGGTPDYTYSWSNGETSSTNLHPTDGLNTVTVTDANGCTTTADFTIDLSSAIDISVPDSLSVCQGDFLQIELINNNPGNPLTYQWTPAEMIVSGADSPTPVINTSAAGISTANVVVTDTNNCFVSRDVVIVVTDTSASTIDPGLVTYSQCEGLTVDFTNDNAGDYEWHFDYPANDTAVSTESNASYTYDTPGNYTVALVPVGTCEAPYTFDIEVFDAPVVDFDYQGGDCSGNLQFNDLSVVPGGVTAWHWDFGSFGTADEQNPVLAVTTDASFDVTLTINFGDGCELSITKPVSVSIFNPVLPPASVVSCDGLPVELNPNGDSTLTYAWSPDDGTLSDTTAYNPIAMVSGDATYTVVISMDTCSVEATVEVIRGETPSFIVSEDVAVCDSTEVTVSAMGTGDLDYMWYDDADLTNPVSADSLLTVTAGNPQQYYVVATDENGCSNTDSVLIGDYAVSIELVDSLTACIEGGVSVEVENLNPGDTLTYMWMPDDAIIIDDAESGTPVLSPDTATTFFVTVMNQYGCSVTDSVFVELNNPIDGLVIEAEPDTIVAGETTQLSVTGNIDGLTFSWIPAESLDDPTSPTPIATPDETTNYIVEITDENGCTATLQVTVVVLPSICDKPYVFFPNVFTPNDDDLNDVLKVQGVGLEKVYYAIYNRWGEKVYECHSLNDGWDGTYKGERVCADVYGYYLKVTCMNGGDYFEKGNISVIR